MNDELEKTQRLLEEATAPGDAPADGFDAEAVRLRKAWLALGQLLDAAQPAVGAAVELPHQLDPLLPFPLGEGQGMRAIPPARSRRWRLTAAGLMAASLLIALATVWTLRGTDRREATVPVPEQTDLANGLQWDDSLDEQIAQVGWQMICAQADQWPKLDPFEQLQYRVERLRREIQADTL